MWWFWKLLFIFFLIYETQPINSRYWNDFSPWIWIHVFFNWLIWITLWLDLLFNGKIPLFHWYWWWVTSKPILIFVNRNGPYTNLQSQANSFATIWMRQKVTTKRHILTKNIKKKQLIWRLTFRSRRVLTLPWTARSSKTPQQIEAVCIHRALGRKDLLFKHQIHCHRIQYTHHAIHSSAVENKCVQLIDSTNLENF